MSNDAPNVFPCDRVHAKDAGGDEIMAGALGAAELEPREVGGRGTTRKVTGRGSVFSDN